MKSKNIRATWSMKRLAFTVVAASGLSLSPAMGSSTDLDGDGVANLVDPDVDGDGILNGRDRNVDGGVCRSGPRKGKYVGDRLANDDPAEKDIDGDGLRDDSNAEKDIDGDGMKDDFNRELDIDGDGRKDSSNGERDTDGDGRRNGKEDDCDGDGKGRVEDRDDDGDGIPDHLDDDDDNDSLSDDDENEVEARLTATAAAPSGSRARAKIKLLPSGKIEFEIDGRGFAVGNYDVIVDGQILGPLSMINDDGRTEGEVEFETNPNKSDELPLPFNPFGLPVRIAKGGVDYFFGTVPTPTDIFIDDDDDDDDSDDD